MDVDKALQFIQDQFLSAVHRKDIQVLTTTALEESSVSHAFDCIAQILQGKKIKPVMMRKKQNSILGVFSSLFVKKKSSSPIEEEKKDEEKKNIAVTYQVLYITYKLTIERNPKINIQSYQSLDMEDKV